MVRLPNHQDRHIRVNGEIRHILHGDRGVFTGGFSKVFEIINYCGNQNFTLRSLSSEVKDDLQAGS